MTPKYPAIVLSPPRLTICWLRAVRQVQAQMERGCELRDEFTAGGTKLSAARAECALWLRDVSDVLRSIVDNPSLIEQFSCVFGERGADSPVYADTPAAFTRGVNAGISGLWGVMQRLEFLADPSGQRRSRWVSFHVILQSAAERQWQHYYLPS